MNKAVTINTQQYQISLISEDIELLKEFLSLTKSIQRLSFINNFSTSINMSGSVDQPFIITAKLPSEEDLSVFLHKMRPLILENERTYFTKITGFIGKVLADENLRIHLKDLNKKFKISKSHQPVLITINDTDITDERTLFVWLNAYEYHRDMQKIEELKPIIDFLGMETFKTLMVDKLVIKFNVVQELAYMVEHLIDESDRSVVIQIGKSDENDLKWQVTDECDDNIVKVGS